ncbi:MAG: rhomboid family intramembrane serine protease [Polyangiaceae bacterium]
MEGRDETPPPRTSGRAAERAFVASLGARVYVVYVLMVANVAVLAALATQGVSVLAPTTASLRAWGGLHGRALRAESWRMLTSMFLHYGVLHLAANLFGMWLIGRAAEAILGNVAFVGVYLLSGLAGALASAWWQPDVVYIGASGAIMGMYGALLAEVRLQRERIPEAARRWLVIKVLTMTVLTLVPGLAMRELGFAAHFGGFVVGYAAALVLDARRRAPPWDARLRRAGVFALSAVVWVLAVTAGPSPESRTSAEIERSRAAIAAILEDYEAASASLRAKEIDRARFASILEERVVPAWAAEVKRAERFSPEEPFRQVFAAWIRYLNGCEFGFRLVMEGEKTGDDQRVKDGILRIQVARELLPKDVGSE